MPSFSQLSARATLVFAMASKALAQCETSTETVLAVATTLSDYEAFRSSMDEIYSTAEDVFTGAVVYVWTTLDDSPAAGTYTAYGVYDANALTSAGYTITTETATVTMCQTTTEETASLPPSPTGADCSPHGDHWHCDEPEETGASTATVTDSATCEPHGDHWHCPSGVPEPTAPPAASVTGDDHDHDHEATASTCEPHGDHWHCPPGVAEPTAPPAITDSTLSVSVSPTPTDSASLSEFTGAASRTGVAAQVVGFGVVAGLVGAFDF